MSVPGWLAWLQPYLVPDGIIALRMVLAMLLGAAIGLERELRDRSAGLKTHMLTALAAATFAVLTLELYNEVRADSDRPSADPTRVVEAVTAGVAFLAAGAIISGRGQVHGLTTGAGIWLAGSIGVACGIGRYAIAIFATCLALVILSVIRPLERRLVKHRETPASASATAPAREDEPWPERPSNP